MFLRLTSCSAVFWSVAICTRTEMEDFLREAACMKEFDHQNVMRLLGKSDHALSLLEHKNYKKVTYSNMDFTILPNTHCKKMLLKNSHILTVTSCFFITTVKSRKKQWILGNICCFRESILLQSCKVTALRVDTQRLFQITPFTLIHYSLHEFTNIAHLTERMNTNEWIQPMMNSCC